TVAPREVAIKPGSSSAGRIEWEAYTPLRAQATLTQTGSVVIYVRSDKVTRCREFENAYLLHPETVRYIGARTVYYLDASTEQGAAMARQLRVYRVPTIISMERGDLEPTITGMTFTDQ